MFAYRKVTSLITLCLLAVFCICTINTTTTKAETTYYSSNDVYELDTQRLDSTLGLAIAIEEYYRLTGKYPLQSEDGSPSVVYIGTENQLESAPPEVKSKFNETSGVRVYSYEELERELLRVSNFRSPIPLDPVHSKGIKPNYYFYEVQHGTPEPFYMLSFYLDNKYTFAREVKQGYNKVLLGSLVGMGGEHHTLDELRYDNDYHFAQTRVYEELSYHDYNLNAYHSKFVNSSDDLPSFEEEPVLFILEMLIYIVYGIFALVGYIFYSIGLQRMAKRESIRNTWLVWLPFIQYYVMGNLVKGRKIVRSGKQFALTLLIFTVVLATTGAILGGLDSPRSTASILILIIFILTVLTMSLYIWILHYFILAKYTKHATLFFLLSIFVSPAVMLFAIFAIRNNLVLYPKETNRPEVTQQNEEPKLIVTEEIEKGDNDKTGGN